MPLRLPCGIQFLREHIGVGVAREQRKLKKHQVRGPYRRRATKTRKNHFREQRLKQEEQKRAQENYPGEEQSQSTVWRGRRSGVHFACSVCSVDVALLLAFLFRQIPEI